MRLFGRLGRQALFALDPETAHSLSIAALKSGVPLCGARRPDPRHHAAARPGRGFEKKL